MHGVKGNGILHNASIFWESPGGVFAGVFPKSRSTQKEWMATAPAHIMRVPALQCNIRAFKAMNPPSVVNRPSQGKLEDSISKGIHKIRKHSPSLLLSTVS